MAYCLAVRLHEGLVFLSDTLTNAGIDSISTYHELHVIRPSSDRVFVLESAGNLATTHKILDRIQGDLAQPGGDHESLATVGHGCSRHLAGAPGGQLHPSVGRSAIPADR